MSWFASSCSSAWWSRNAALLRWCMRMRRRFSKMSSINPIQQRRPRFEACGRFAEALHRATPDFVQAHVQGQQDLVLALEVVIDRGFREPELVGNLAQGGLVEALLDEEVHRDVEDAIASHSPAARVAPRALEGVERPVAVRGQLGSRFYEACPSSYLTTGK